MCNCVPAGSGGEREARNWYVFHAAPRPIYRGSSRRNFKRGLTYARVRTCVSGARPPSVEIAPDDETVRNTVADRRPSDHLLAFRNLRGHKVSRCLISSNTRVVEGCVRARASFYCVKGWRAAAVPNEGWAAVIVGKLNFVPEGQSDEVCWQLENLRLTARMRHQAPEYIPEKIFPPSFSLFFSPYSLFIFFHSAHETCEYRYRETLDDCFKIRLDLPWGTHPWWQFSQ